MKDELQPYIDKLRNFALRGSGRLDANEVHVLGQIWSRTNRGILDPSCGACVLKMCKDLVSWYDVN